MCKSIFSLKTAYKIMFITLNRKITHSKVIASSTCRISCALNPKWRRNGSDLIYSNYCQVVLVKLSKVLFLKNRDYDAILIESKSSVLVIAIDQL